MAGVREIPFRRIALPQDALAEVQSLGASPELLAKLGLNCCLIYRVGAEEYDLTARASKVVAGIKRGMWVAVISGHATRNPVLVYRPFKRWAQQVALRRALRSFGIPT